jgi:preprotein translocase subunit SecE
MQQFRTNRILMTLTNNKLIKYLREAKEELQKVSWPTQKETVRYSLIVIAITAIAAVYFGVVDQLLNLGLEALLNLTN